MSYKVTFVRAREISFFLDAENQQDIHDFLMDHQDWEPGDIEGLIETVSEEEELGYEIEPSDYTANFELIGGQVKEKA